MLIGTLLLMHASENYQTYPRNNNNTYYNNKSDTGSTIIATTAAVPRPDIRKTVVVGQAATRDSNLLTGPYNPNRRATSPAQSLPEYSATLKSPIDLGSGELYFRHHSYDSAVSGRRISDNVVFNTISEDNIQTNYRADSKSFSSGVSDSPKESSSRGAASPRRLRHQGRVKGTENEPSFSRPTNPARVSLIVSAVESIDFASSDESETEVVDSGRRKQIYSPNPEGRGELFPGRSRKRSTSPSRDLGKSESDHSGRSSPGYLSSGNKVEEMFVPPRTPRSRSRSSPVHSDQGSLDVETLHAALMQHRRSEGDIMNSASHNRKEQTESYPQGENGNATRKTNNSQQLYLGGRKSGAATLSSTDSTTPLPVNKEILIPTAGRQRRRSSMQMPIDLRQINPKLYEDMIRMPSMDSEEPDDDTPQIHFSLDYNREMEIMTAKLIQARNLQTQAFSGTCDPYCTVAILPGFNPRQSKVHRRTTDPEFEEKFVFGIKQNDLKLKTLEIRTYDFDQFSRDECTGVMSMKLNALDFDMTQHYDLWKKFRLQDLSSSKSTESCGDLLLALSYLPSAEKLTVAIQKARNLKSAENRKGSPDPYIKVCIYRGNQRLKKKKTDTMHNTYNPVFNQALTFSMTPELLQCPIMRITCQVVHDQKLSANEDLGFLQIGPNSSGEEELNHWRDVTGKHSNKPVARWHRLKPVPTNADDDGSGQFLNLADIRRSSSAFLNLSGKPDVRRRSSIEPHL